MKKILALLLALLIVMALVGCKTSQVEDNAQGNTTAPKDNEKLTEDVSTDEEQIVGTWSMVLDLSDSIEAIILSDMAGVKTTAPLNLVVKASFTKYGQFSGSLAYDQEAVEVYRQELSQAMIDFVYADAQQQGLSKEAYDEWFAGNNDQDLQTFVTKLVNDTVGDQKPTCWESAYRIDPEAGMIYTAADKESLDTPDACLVYQLEGDQLTLDQAEGSVENEIVTAMGLSYPWVLERK